MGGIPIHSQLAGTAWPAPRRRRGRAPPEPANGGHITVHCSDKHPETTFHGELPKFLWKNKSKSVTECVALWVLLARALPPLPNNNTEPEQKDPREVRSAKAEG